MEPITSTVDKLKSLAKSGEDFISGIIRRRQNSSSRNPIEILKRLQREAFSDLMNLRDRQEKVEKMLTFYRTSKGGGPFQEEATRVKGEVDLLSALLLFNDLQRQQGFNEISGAGIRTGIVSRLIFQTRVREKDALEAEFMTSQNSQGYSDNASGSALSISKVGYTASIDDWLSLVAIPIGARFRDVAVNTSSSQEKGLTEYSSNVPPILHQQNGSAIGLMVRTSNAVASLAQFVSELEIHPSAGFGHCFSTFGQIACQLPRSTMLMLYGAQQVSKYSLQGNFGPLTIPLGVLKGRRPVDMTAETSQALEANSEIFSSGSVALMLESELDDNTQLGGWVQLRNSEPKCIQWAVNLSDSPEDAMGWGLSIGGMVQGPANRVHFQVEASLKFKMGKRFTLQPGIVYLMDGTNQMPAIMFRSTWSL